MIATTTFPLLRGTKPFLKWAGGKRWFAESYGESLRTEIHGHYFEPFLGGGAMALHLALPAMVLSDLESDLILTFVAVRDEPAELSELLRSLEQHGTDERTYYQVRDTAPEHWLEVAARTIYLNRLGFNGLYRKNRQGQFNVPYGKAQKLLPGLDQLSRASEALQDASISVAEFADTIAYAGDGDVVYADPPYDGSFSDYTAHGFDDRKRTELVMALVEAANRGALVVAHDADTPLVRELYSERFHLFVVEEKRAINSDGQKRGVVPCLVAVSKR